MRIVIGESTEVGTTAQYRPDNEPFLVEARLLEIRDRRETTDSGGVISGRVVTLLVTEGQKIPRGIESGDYRIYLKFVHRRHARF
jgi:hypothetical protein